MTNQVKRTLVAALFATMLAGGSASAQVSIGIQIGAPPRPRAVRMLPRRPGPEYVWVDGFWYPQGKKHYRWREGYWAPIPYAGAYWVAPSYYDGRYYDGYWSRGRSRAEKWDDRGRGNFRGRGRR